MNNAEWMIERGYQFSDVIIKYSDTDKCRKFIVLVKHEKVDECVYGLPDIVAYSAESMKKCVNGWNRRGDDDAID